MSDFYPDHVFYYIETVFYSYEGTEYPVGAVNAEVVLADEGTMI